MARTKKVMVRLSPDEEQILEMLCAIFDRKRPDVFRQLMKDKAKDFDKRTVSDELH